MAIDKKGSGRGKTYPAKAADGTTTQVKAQHPWSRRVQEAPKPLSAKAIAAAKDKKAAPGSSKAGDIEGEDVAEVSPAKKAGKKVSAVSAAAEDKAEAVVAASPAAGGKKRKAPAAAAVVEEDKVAAPSPSSSKVASAAKPSPSSKKAKTTPSAEASTSTSSTTKKSSTPKSKKAASPPPSKAKFHFLKDDPIPLLKGLETEATQSGYHSTSEDDEDSSDDEDESEGEGADSGPVEGVELMKLPTIAKDDASVKRKLERARKTGVRPPHFSFLLRGWWRLKVEGREEKETDGTRRDRLS